ncbi:DUF1819 family protein [Atopococcus tabaci]|uniref:DUF1819 family protein n=1 Tax=Atopococcus tabaci TaxID=269774 RepID=UPI00240A3FBE|nr:DUF1819 family protein [Atopococcus tabaci]
MTEKNYLTTLNTRPFLYAETKIVATFLHQGKKHEEILKQIMRENLFQLNSSDRTMRFFSEILKRLDELDVFLFNQLLFSDEQTSKAILFYAILKKDQLLYEWMREVVWEKFLVLDWYLNKEETKAFFKRKAEDNQTIANWTTETKQLLMDAYHRLLEEVDMAVIDGEELQLQRPAIDYDLRRYLIERKEKEIVEVILGELMD